MKKLLATLCLAIVPGIASSATQIVDADGILLGATGVDVGGVLYDVAFREGTCISVFAGCDQSADFPFAVAVAQQALRSQVFVDTPLGNFGTNGINLTFGCLDRYGCIVMTPFRLGAPGQVTVDSSLFNPFFPGLPVAIAPSDISTTFDTVINEDFIDYVFASFTPAVSAPGAGAMFGVGLLALMALLRGRGTGTG